MSSINRWRRLGPVSYTHLEFIYRRGESKWDTRLILEQQPMDWVKY